ncbi:MAG TPA: hypothetical protein PK323_13970, partial [Bacteroidia bacterium]|nr:hypothetical protein [Bacteroidia bacterium]
MKKNILFTVTYFISILLHAQNLEWAKGIGGAGLDQGRALTNDASGNVYTVGKFSNTVDFDPGTGVFNLTAAGSWDGYVMKFDANGNFIWARQISGVNEEYCESIALDNSGNILVGGHYAGTTDFNPGAGIYNLTAVGGEDIFILKLDASGNFLWAKSVGGGNADYNNAIAADPQGNVYAVGQFTFTVDFDPGPGTFNLTWTNGGHYVLKLDASGNFVWAYGLNATINDIHIDNAGNYYYTGNFAGTVDFDPSAAVYNLSTSFNAMFVVKFNSAGSLIWANRMECNGLIESRSICTDQSGNVITCGNFEGTADFNPSAAPFNIVSNGDWDAFINKLDATGAFLWTDRIGGTLREYAFGIDSDINNNIYVAGAFQGTVDFDPYLSFSYMLTALALVDAYTLKLNPSGSFAWAIPFQGFDQTYNYSIAANDNGSAYVTGDFSASTDFDPAAGFQFISPVGGADAYICKLGTCATLPTTGNISGNNAVCAGTVINYSIAPVAGATTYNWTVPSGYFINSGQNTTSISVYIGGNSGNITVTPANGCTNGSLSSLPITVIPLPTPSTISANGNTTFCAGGSVTLTGNSGGTWNTGATTSSITVNNSGSYYVTNSNSCGTVNSNQINVTVLQAPVASSISANSNTTFCAGGSVTLSGNAGGTWNTGATTASITVNNSGTYYVTNTNSCGTVISNQINVTVNPLPTASNIVANGNTTICTGGSVTLSGNVGGTWNTGATTASITVTNAGVYYVTNTNACGTVFSNQITVNVSQLPIASTINANGSTTFCAGSSVTLSGNSGGVWNTGSNAASITVTSSGDYFVTNSNSCGSVESNHILVTVNPLPAASSIVANGNTTFCNGGSVILSGNVGGTWNTGATGSSITVSNTGVFYVTNSNSCGNVFSNQITVTVNQAPMASTIIANGNTTICVGNSITLTGNVGGIWNTGSSNSSITVNSSGNYFVTNSNACGTVQSDTITVSVIAAPVASTINASGNTTFCAGSSVTLNGNVGGTWNTGATSASITVNNGGVYYVTNSNACGSVNSNQINVTVNPLPVADSISAGGVTTFCSGDFVVLFGNSGGIWNTGTSASSINVTSSGNYFVTYTNSCGNSFSNTIPVTVESLPFAPVIQSNGATNFCNGGSVVLTGNTNGIWNTGLDSTEINVTTTGDFYVNVINSCGSTTSNHIQVNVWPTPTVPTINLN